MVYSGLGFSGLDLVGLGAVAGAVAQVLSFSGLGVRV